MSKYAMNIFYTSDVHGSITGIDYATNKKSPHGLARLSTFLHEFDKNRLLLDNGDILQGSPMQFHWVRHSSADVSPVNIALNHMRYDYGTLGNHDFNFGEDILTSYINNSSFPILCCNVRDGSGNPIFKPFAIHMLDNGIRLGIIGAVTHYIPHWEKKQNIVNFTFYDAFESIKQSVEKIRHHVDFVIVLYHGGFEKDLLSGNPIGRPTSENQGYKIASMLDIDLLLTGHQHRTQSAVVVNGTLTMQTSDNAINFGHIQVTFSNDSGLWRKDSIDGKIIPCDFPEDEKLIEKIAPYEEATQSWLDQPVGMIEDCDLMIRDPFEARKNNHPIFHFVNHLQMKKTNAMLSCASLANDATGLPSIVSMRNIESTFRYPNHLIVLEITGEILKEALEKTAGYFDLVNGKPCLSSMFQYPKLEHYNYDIYDGIEYSIDLRCPLGERITQLTYKSRPISSSDTFTLVLNNYRAIGGGDYPMFSKAKIIQEFDVTLGELVYNHFEKNKKIIIPKSNHITLLY